MGTQVSKKTKTGKLFLFLFKLSLNLPSRREAEEAKKQARGGKRIRRDDNRLSVNNARGERRKLERERDEDTSFTHPGIARPWTRHVRQLPSSPTYAKPKLRRRWSGAQPRSPSASSDCPADPIRRVRSIYLSVYLGSWNQPRPNKLHPSQPKQGLHSPIENFSRSAEAPNELFPPPRLFGPLTRTLFCLRVFGKCIRVTRYSGKRS